MKNIIITGLALGVLLLGALTTAQSYEIGALKGELTKHEQTITLLAQEVGALKAQAHAPSAVKKPAAKRQRPKGDPTYVVATGYSNDPISIDVPEWRDGMTATGTVARKGVCAADWRVFPPGTKFWVPGYGECVVEDRGGAIKGNKIDLFFDAREEALAWGVKRRDVILLKMGKHGRWKA